MYLSGQFYDFERRLHKFPTGDADLTLFKIEGQSYTGVVATGYPYLIKHWNKEYVKRADTLGFITGNVF